MQSERVTHWQIATNYKFGEVSKSRQEFATTHTNTLGLTKYEQCGQYPTRIELPFEADPVSHPSHYQVQPSMFQIRKKRTRLQK